MTQRPRRRVHDARTGGFILPSGLKEAAERQAVKEGISFSEMIRRALKKYLGWKL